MKTSAIVLLLFVSVFVSAQEKPKAKDVPKDSTIILDLNKLQSTFKDLLKRREEAVKSKEQAEDAIKAIDGALQAFQIVATDTSLQVQKPKK